MTKIKLPLEYEASLRNLEISIRNYGVVSPDLLIKTYQQWFVDRYFLALAVEKVEKLEKQNKSDQKAIDILYWLNIFQTVLGAGFVLYLVWLGKL